MPTATVLSSYDALLPWTKYNWDRLIGTRYRAVSDLGSLFAEDLILAYPDAKVVLVERPLDEWIESMRAVIAGDWIFGIRGFILCTLGPLVHVWEAVVVKDMILGWLQADSFEEAYRRMPIAYKEHSAMVRRLVLPERLLVMSLDDGWEPLCRFLSVPVPDVPFPCVNERNTMRQKVRWRVMLILARVLKRLALLLSITVALRSLMARPDVRKFIVATLRRLTHWYS
jgi:hypothetical protein